MNTLGELLYCGAWCICAPIYWIFSHLWALMVLLAVLYIILREGNWFKRKMKG